MTPPLNSDEELVLTLIRQRLEGGVDVYGPLVIATDPRDWLYEALCEALDGCVYLAVRLVKMLRALGRIPS